MLPPSELSKNQINRLGDRLRTADISELDLRLLMAIGDRLPMHTKMSLDVFEINCD